MDQQSWLVSAIIGKICGKHIGKIGKIAKISKIMQYCEILRNNCAINGKFKNPGLCVSLEF